MVPPSDEATRRRNVRHVLLGTLGGLCLGLAFVGALLVFAPRERRPDRLFGAWVGTGLGVLGVIVVLAVASAFATQGSGNPTSPPAANIAEDGEPHRALAASEGARRSWTAPEVVAAVRASQPNFCTPEYFKGFEEPTAFMIGPSKRADGDWIVGCKTEGMTAASNWLSIHQCLRVDAETLEVTNIGSDTIRDGVIGEPCPASG